jgi:hypothetical protein
MSEKIENVLPTEASQYSSSLKAYVENIRKRKVFPVYSGIGSGASESSRIVFDIVSDQSVDLSSHTIYLKVKGFNVNHEVLRSHSTIDYLRISNGSTVLENIHDYDHLSKMINFLDNSPEKDSLYNSGAGFYDLGFSKNLKNKLSRDIDFSDSANGESTAIPPPPAIDAVKRPLINSYYDKNRKGVRDDKSGFVMKELYNQLQNDVSYVLATDTADGAGDGLRLTRNRNILNAHLGAMRHGLEGVTEVAPNQPTEAEHNDALEKQSWISIKLNASGFMNMNKNLPLKLFPQQKLTITIGINAKTDKAVMTLHDWNKPKTGKASKLVVTDAYLQMDEIAYPERYWAGVMAEMSRRGGVHMVYNTFATQKGVAQVLSQNHSYVFNERRLYLRYMLMGFFNEDNFFNVSGKDGLNFTGTGLFDQANHNFAPAKPDVMEMWLRDNLVEYDVHLNQQSMTDGNVKIYDAERPVLSEGFQELEKVSKIINNNRPQMEVPPENYVKDKCLIAVPFSAGFGEADQEELNDIISGIDNTQRTGQIVTKVRFTSNPVAVKNYFMCVNYTTIIKLLNNGRIELVS